METVEYVLREMRKDAVDAEHSPAVWAYIDRIEAAWKREKDAVEQDALAAGALVAEARRVRRNCDRFDYGEDADKAAINALKDKAKKADDAAKDFPSRLLDEVVKRVGFKAYMTQLERKNGRTFDPLCVRGKIRAVIKRCDELLDAMKPKEPTHTYVAQFETTDSDLKKLRDLMEKVCAKYRFVTPQSDAAYAEIEDWFIRNSQN